MDFLIGDIHLFSFNYAPNGWFYCNGALLQINIYQALYSLIGNSYGGNASQGTFALPNMQGEEPIPGLRYCICIDGIYPQRS